MARVEQGLIAAVIGCNCILPQKKYIVVCGCRLLGALILACTCLLLATVLAIAVYACNAMPALRLYESMDSAGSCSYSNNSTSEQGDNVQQPQHEPHLEQSKQREQLREPRQDRGHLAMHHDQETSGRTAGISRVHRTASGGSPSEGSSPSQRSRSIALPLDDRLSDDVTPLLAPPANLLPLQQEGGYRGV